MQLHYCIVLVCVCVCACKCVRACARVHLWAGHHGNTQTARPTVTETGTSTSNTLKAQQEPTQSVVYLQRIIR